VNDKGTGCNWASILLQPWNEAWKLTCQSCCAICMWQFKSGPLDFLLKKNHLSLQMLLSHLHLPLGTYKIKYTPKLLHHPELIQTPLTKLHLRCPHFHSLEKWAVLPAPFFPWPDKTRLLPFLQSSFAQYCQSKGLLFAMLS
jgi:hypothetical protein